MHRFIQSSIWATLLFCMWTIGAADAQEAGSIKFEKRTCKFSTGEEVHCELGTLYVLENRDDPNSRVIGIGFARFPSAAAEVKSPPVFRLPGGPGYSFVNLVRAKRVDLYLPLLKDFRRFADVVYVDQRGFSAKGDVLKSTITYAIRPKDRAPQIEDNVEDYRKFAKRVAKEYAAEGKPDLRGYTVKECAHDVADLCQALKYKQIALTGTSFGSQWSFAVMRLHPDLVARALLSGVEPLDHGYDMPSHVFAALQRMWRSVDEDPRFEPYLPEGGMAEAARVVVERLEQGVEIRDDDEDKQVLAVLGPTDFPWRSPTEILEMYHSRWDRWRRRAKARGARPSQREINLIWPLIDSSLGVTPERGYQLRTDPATRYLGRRFDYFIKSAEFWPSADVGDEFRRHNYTEIPVVFAQGDWDTKTPVENTYEISTYFPNSRVLIARRGGHGVLHPIARRHPNTWAQLVQFVRSGDMRGIPTQVRLSASERFSPPSFKPPQSR